MGNDTKANNGVVYVAFGRPYLAMALHSIRSLRAKNGDLPVFLITNIPVTIAELPLDPAKDTLHVMDMDQSRNRDIKTSVYALVPFERTAFIDCDTVILGDLTDGFRFLDYFDLALRLNPYPQTRKGKADIEILDGLAVGDCPHWNSGVVFFRKSDLSAAFFKAWVRNFKELANPYDQVSLVRTIFQEKARVLSLDARWNATDPFLQRARWRKRTKIFHYATNISDKLVHDVVAADRQIPMRNGTGGAGDTRALLLRKRQSRLKDQGWLRYFVARVFWLVSSPT